MFRRPEQRTRRLEAREATLLLFGLCFGWRGRGFVFESASSCFVFVVLSLSPGHILDSGGSSTVDVFFFFFSGHLLYFSDVQKELKRKLIQENGGKKKLCFVLCLFEPLKKR